MKRFTMIMALVLMVSMQVLSQDMNCSKITPDLLEEINGSKKSGEMFKTIVFLNDQFDSQKLARQTQHLSKVQQRKYVMSELQQVSRMGQSAILKDLDQGLKANLVEDIRSFWIINAISCSMTKDMVYAIADRPDVRYVMKDFEIYVADGEASERNQHEQSGNQWNVTKVHAPEVWNLGYTGQGIIVAVIDSGVNYNHTDIANNMWDGGDEYPNHGWDFANNDNDPMDDVDHGTHCAGTVSSYGNNGKQCGIAKDTKIMALKTLVPKPNGSGGTGLTSDGWAAVEFAVSHGADILSMSLGSAGKGGNWAYRAIMENVLHCGVIASVSAGNEGSNLSSYPKPNNVSSPGNCPSPWRHPDQTLNGGRAAVVAVGATTSNDTHSSFSSYGPSTWAYGANIGYYNDYRWTENNPDSIGLIKPDISAPGSGIWSLSHTSNTGYLSMNGTSMAAPCVAGVMALMLSANPTLTPVEIDSIIETTAIPCGGQTSKNNTFGAGRIDALAAINYMLEACAVPTNLVATVNEADVDLHWDAAENVTSYRIYRNGAMIAQSVSDNTFIDANAPAGTNTYFVRSNGENYKASMPSNQVTVSITTNVDFAPCNLAIENTDENSATLSWESPSPMEKALYHTASGTTYLGNNNQRFITAQRFPSSMLQQYNGMQIEHIYFSVENTDVECSIELFEGDAMQPNRLIHSGTFTTSEQEQSVDYIVNPAICVNSDKDLWLLITMSDRLLINNNYESNGNGDAFMFKVSSSDKYWLSNLGLAWSFKIGFSNGEYLYNVYRNGQIVSSKQSTTTFTNSLIDGMNDYHVNSVSNDFESTKSNSIMIVKGTCIQEEIFLAENDKLVVMPNTTLTVGGTLNSNNPENLILENGAQLIHSNAGVKATVKKSIAPIDGNQGWNFIASPVTEDIAPSKGNGLLNGNLEDNTYDLYYYEEPSHYWRNYETHSQDFTIEHKKGYLYANGEEDGTTLQFAGTLIPSNNDVTISDLSHDDATLNGFNLVGNPFTCNATVNTDYYVIDASNNSVELAETSRLISPCEGIFVKASETNNYQVTFSKPTRGNVVSNHVDIVISQGRSTLDRARVRFGEGTNMEKFSLSDNNSRLYIPQNGQDFAVAYASEQKEMPVNFKAMQDGIYTLTLENESLELDYLHLIDNMTGSNIDLLTTPSYTFESKMSDYVSRFRLIFANCEDTDNDNDAPFAYINNGNIIITTDAGAASLQVIDATGRVIRTVGLSQCGSRTTTAGMTSGVYVLRLITPEGVKTQKMIIE